MSRRGNEPRSGPLEELGLTSEEADKLADEFQALWEQSHAKTPGSKSSPATAATPPRPRTTAAATSASGAVGKIIRPSDRPKAPRKRIGQQTMLGLQPGSAPPPPPFDASAVDKAPSPSGIGSRAPAKPGSSSIGGGSSAVGPAAAPLGEGKAKGGEATVSAQPAKQTLMGLPAAAMPPVETGAQAPPPKTTPMQGSPAVRPAEARPEPREEAGEDKTTVFNRSRDAAAAFATNRKATLLGTGTGGSPPDARVLSAAGAAAQPSGGAQARARKGPPPEPPMPEPPVRSRSKPPPEPPMPEPPPSSRTRTSGAPRAGELSAVPSALRELAQQAAVTSPHATASARAGATAAAATAPPATATSPASAADLEALATAGGGAQQRSPGVAPATHTDAGVATAEARLDDAGANQPETPEMPPNEQSGGPTVTSDSAAQAGGYVAPTSAPKRVVTDTLASAGVSPIETRLSPEEQVDLATSDDASRVTRNIRAVEAPPADPSEDEIVVPGVRSGSRKAMYVGAVLIGVAIGAVLFWQRTRAEADPAGQPTAIADDSSAKAEAKRANEENPPAEEANQANAEGAEAPENAEQEKASDDSPEEAKDPESDTTKASEAAGEQEAADEQTEAPKKPAPPPKRTAAPRPAPRAAAPKPRPAAPKPKPVASPRPTPAPAAPAKKTPKRSAIVRENPF